MPIEWSRLPVTVERRRPAKADAAHTDRWGEVDPRLVAKDTAHGAGATPQRIRMLIQPGAGKIDDLPEGVASTASYRGYCNLKTHKAAKGEEAPDTDVLPGDELRVVAIRDRPVAPSDSPDYWVSFVSDEGGQGHHLKLLLRTEDGR